MDGSEAVFHTLSKEDREIFLSLGYTITDLGNQVKVQKNLSILKD